MDADLYQVLKANAPRGTHRTRIEAALGGTPGNPDLNMCWKGIECWAELKKARGWRVKVLPLQASWITQRHNAGGRVFIVVRRLAGTTDDLYILHASAAPLMASHTLRTLPAHHIALHATGGPARWPWPSVWRLFFPA